MSSSESAIAISKPWGLNRTVFDAYLTAGSIGIFTGIAVSYMNTPLHLPGHKVLFWMIPAIAYRIYSRTPKAAATTTVALTQLTAILLGGNLAGGAFMAPLVILAGVLLDLVIGFLERHPLTYRAVLPTLVMAGIAGNLLCFIKRLANPLGPFLSSANTQDLLTVGGFHIVFGALAALIGGTIGICLLAKNKTH